MPSPTLFMQTKVSTQQFYSLTGQVWSKIREDSVSGSIWKLQNLGGRLFRIFDTSSFVATLGGPGDLQRSEDNGVTWTTIFVQDAVNDRGVISLDIAPDGTLWAVWGSHINTGESVKVYKSTDNGDNWTLEHVDGGSGSSAILPADISVDPEDSDRIGIIATRNVGGLRYLISTDGGASFTLKSGLLGGTFTFGISMTHGKNGRPMAED